VRNLLAGALHLRPDYGTRIGRHGGARNASSAGASPRAATMGTTRRCVIRGLEHAGGRPATGHRRVPNVRRGGSGGIRPSRHAAPWCLLLHPSEEREPSQAGKLDASVKLDSDGWASWRQYFLDLLCGKATGRTDARHVAGGDLIKPQVLARVWRSSSRGEVLGVMMRPPCGSFSTAAIGRCSCMTRSIHGISETGQIIFK